jgi:hypothetical protein
MKKVITLLILILFFGINYSAFAQMTGTKTIDNTLPTGGNNYQSFTAAINDLNTQGVGAGGVIFNVIAGQVFTELPPTINATGTSANQIIFQKSGAGADPVISGINGNIAGVYGLNGDAVIRINGGDYLTFNGIDVRDDPSNVTTTTQMEYGYLLTKSTVVDTNGCKNVTISNCAITLNKTNVATIGVFLSNLGTGGSSVNYNTTATTNVSHDNFRCYNNTISNVNTGAYYLGVAAVSPYTLYDQNNGFGVEGRNIVTNFGGSSTIAYGFYASYQNNLKIANDSISGGTGSTSTVYGIYTTSGVNTNVDIYNNAVSLTSGATTSTVYGIYNAMGTSGTTNVVNIYNNRCTAFTYPTATSGAMYLIYISGSPFRLNVYNNTVKDNVKPGTGVLACIYNLSSTVDTIKVYNNTIFNNTNGGASSTYGIYSSTSSTSLNNVYNNTVDSITANGGTSYGYYISSSLVNKYYRNSLSRIYNLTSTSSAIYGMYVIGGTTNYVYNNMVRNLYTPASTSSTAIAGIYFTGGTNDYSFYNTVYLNAVSSSATSFGTMAFYASSTPTVEIRNTILINNSTPGPTSGFSAAYRRTTTTLTTYSNNSNNNIFYAGPLTGGFTTGRKVIYYDGTNADSSMGSYKSRVAPRDNSSYYELPPFVNTSNPPYDLHILPGIPTNVESRGARITSPVTVTDDYDSQIRQGEPGYTGSGSAPDIGADEGEFTNTFVANDVGPIAITPTGTGYYPQGAAAAMTGAVKNFGTATQTFNVTRRILNSSGTVVYTSTRNISALAPNATANVSYADFSFTSGSTYTIRDSTELAGDQDATNDVLVAVVQLNTAKGFLIYWRDAASRDSLIRACNTDGRFANNFDTVNAATYTGPLGIWKTIFALYSGSFVWTPAARDSMIAWLNQPAPTVKNTLVTFGNDVGYYKDPSAINNNSGTERAADSVFYRHYMRAKYLNVDSWYTPFSASNKLMKGLGPFAPDQDTTVDPFPDLIQPINGSQAAYIPFTESGDGDSCTAVYYNGTFNSFYCSAVFSNIRAGAGTTDGPVSMFSKIANWILASQGALPVELSSFNASVVKNDVTLHWTTANELNNKGFQIERKKSDETNWSSLNFIDGKGTINTASDYSFNDRKLSTGKYNYRLKQVDFNGNYQYYNLSNEVNVGIPNRFDLSQNYPNPFNPSTKIDFELPVDGKVTMKLYDITGREVAVLINNELRTAGYYTAEFNGINLASGVYFYRLNVEGSKQFNMVKKMMLVK